MLKSLLSCGLFIIIAAIGWALVAPLLFPGADLVKLGEVSFPVIVVGGVLSWYLIGLRRSKDRKQKEKKA